VCSVAFPGITVSIARLIQKAFPSRERFFYFPPEKASMTQKALLPKNSVFPDLVGDIPVVVFYVDVAHDRLLEYRMSKLSEVAATIAVIQENQIAQKGDRDGQK
jgi:hypothetical protein